MSARCLRQRRSPRSSGSLRRRSFCRFIRIRSMTCSVISAVSARPPESASVQIGKSLSSPSGFSPWNGRCPRPRAGPVSPRSNGSTRSWPPATGSSLDTLLAREPDVIVLMPCGFDVERSAADVFLLAGRPGWGSVPAVRSGEVYAVHGAAYFNRSGPRLVEGVEILAEVLHPEIFPRRHGSEDYRRLEEVAA